MKYLYVGKIVNTHGIRGEVRLLSNFKFKEKVFINGFKIYIGNDKCEEIITNYRVHKQFDMLCFEGITNINEILKYKGLKVYINSDDLKLNNNEYLDKDLINLKVICDNKFYGYIKDIEINDKNDLLIVSHNNQEFLIPYQKALIEKIDFKNKQIFLIGVGGLFK